MLLVRENTYGTVMSYARNDFENAGLLKPGHYNFQIGAPNPAFLKKVAGHLEVGTSKLVSVKN